MPNSNTQPIAHCLCCKIPIPLHAASRITRKNLPTEFIGVCATCKAEKFDPLLEKAMKEWQQMYQGAYREQNINGEK